MDIDKLILGENYYYFNHNNEKVKVKYLGVESDGLTLYNFRHYTEKFVYSLFEFEVNTSIKENKPSVGSNF